MTKNIIFVEKREDLQAIHESLIVGAFFIALHPSAAVELSRRGLPFQNTLSLFGKNGHEKTLKKSQKIVESLRPFLKNIKANDINQAFEKTWVVYFRIYLNNLLAILHIINSAVESYNPRRFIVIKNENEKHNTLFEIIQDYAKSNSIEIECIYKKSKNNLLNKNFFLNFKWLNNLIFNFQLHLLSIIINKRSNFLVLSDANNMPRFIGRLSQYFDDYFPIYLSAQNKTIKIRLLEMFRGQTFTFLCTPKNISANSIESFQIIYNGCTSKISDYMDEANDDFNIHMVDIRNPIIKFINNRLKENMTELYGEIISLKKVLALVKPKSVFSQHSLGIGYALGEICSKEDIPGLLITHGTHTPQKDPLPSYEWSVHAHQIFNSMYPFVALQSPLAKKFFLSQKEVFSKTIETGPICFAEKNNNTLKKNVIRQRLFGQNNLKKKIILHAGSPRGWKFYRPWVYETIDEYINNINTTIKAVEEISGIFLCIRFRPQRELSLEEFKNSLLNSNCYGVYTDGSFDEFLESADLLMSYSSTTIEEALFFKMPVLQFDPDAKYEHIQGQKLSSNGVNKVSTIYSVLSESDLLPALKWWQKNHTDDINKTLDWNQYIFANDDNMEWLKLMDIKC